MIFLLVLSCDLIEPEETFYNVDAEPPVEVEWDFLDIKQGQHLAGNIMFTFNPDTITDSIFNVIFVLDTSFISTAYSPPYNFSLNTAEYSEGEHVIALFVRERGNNNIGLLNIIEGPTAIFTTTVNFDQSSPLPVTLLSAVWQDRQPLLSWTKNNDLNFYSYEISRDGNWGSNNNIVIKDQSTTSYLDITNSALIGTEINYTVSVNNRAESSISNELNITLGEKLPIDFNLSFSSNWPVLNFINNEIYLFEGLSNTLIALSPIDNTILRETWIDFTGILALNLNATELYVFSTFPTITVLNPNDFNIIRTFNLPAGTNPGRSIAVGSNDYLYIAVTHPFSASIKRINTISGAVKDFLTLDPLPSLLAIDSDNNILYAASLNTIYKIDVSSDSAQVLSQIVISERIEDLHLSKDNLRLFVRLPAASPSRIEILNTSNLSSANMITGSLWIHDLYITPSFLYVSEARNSTEAKYFQPGRVTQYDISDLSTLKSWDFVLVPTKILLSGNEEYLYSFGSTTWVVDTN